jgi:hypothetical protein
MSDAPARLFDRRAGTVLAHRWPRPLTARKVRPVSYPARSTLEPPDYDGHFVMIPLTKGKFAIFDEADAEMVLRLGRWRTLAKERTCYATSRAGSPRRTILMHALIAGFKGPDHVNRNGLDNRRINLRPATASQNTANRGRQSNNTSGYKGVVWGKRISKWIARIQVDGKQTYLGFFDDPVEAAHAYNQAASAAFGEYAELNPLPAAWTGPVSRPPTTPGRNNASRPPRSDNTSGYKGVTWNRKARGWQAVIRIDGTSHYLGLFEHPLDAAHRYNEAAVAAWGEYAWLNPIYREGFRPEGRAA